MPTLITLLPINSVWEIVKNGQKLTFFNFQAKTVTLTFGQGHPMVYYFEGLSLSYFLATFHNSSVNGVWNIVKNGQKWLFCKFPVNAVTLTEGQGYIILKVPPHATFGPSLITLLQIVSEIMSMLKFVTHRQPDRQTTRQTDGETPEGHYIDSFCLHTWAKNHNSFFLTLEIEHHQKAHLCSNM